MFFPFASRKGRPPALMMNPHLPNTSIRGCSRVGMGQRDIKISGASMRFNLNQAQTLTNLRVNYERPGEHEIMHGEEGSTTGFGC